MNKITRHITKTLLILSFLSSIIGCTGFSVQGNSAQPGETVSVAIGYQQNLTKSNMTIEVTDSVGDVTIYNPDDPAVQMVINMYPDPISVLLVSRETNLGTVGSTSNGAYIERVITADSKDLSQSVAFFDLPQSIALGTANIQVYKDNVALIPTTRFGATELTVEIVGSTSDSQDWETDELGTLNASMFGSLRRVDKYGVITFDGSVPYAIQLTLNHDPDIDNGGVDGRPFITSPRGDIISISSNDDGTKMNIILSPVQVNKPALLIEHFKFYVAGNITGWQISPDSVLAFDENGDIVTGVLATLTTHY